MKHYLTLGLLALMGTLSAQTDAEKAAETVDKNKIEGHIYFLADDLLKGRNTGSPENKIAASYLANTLRSYGVKPNPESGNYYQKMDLYRFFLPEKINLSLDGMNFPEVVAFDIDTIASEENVLYLNYGLESDYAGKDVKGKIVVAKAGTPEASDMRSAFGSRAPKRELAIKMELKA